MADERQSPPPDAPPQSSSTPPPPQAGAPPTPPLGEAYGSGRGSPPPSSHPFGSPPRADDSRSRLQGGPPAPPTHPQPAWSPQPAPPPSATPEQLAAAARLTRLGLLSAIAAPLVTLVNLPYTAVLGLGFGILAIVLGARARRASVVAGRSEAGGVVAVVFGSVGTAFIAVVAALYLVFWGEIRTYEDCLAGANTKQAETVCSEGLIDDARRRVGLD